MTTTIIVSFIGHIIRHTQNGIGGVFSNAAYRQLILCNCLTVSSYQYYQFSKFRLRLPYHRAQRIIDMGNHVWTHERHLGRKYHAFLLQRDFSSCVRWYAVVWGASLCMLIDINSYFTGEVKVLTSNMNWGYHLSFSFHVNIQAN